MPPVIWKGYISFGLVSFPVRLFAAAEDDERPEIVEGYETSKGSYVVGDDELNEIAPVTGTSMDVFRFVKEAEVDPIFFDHSYYVAPGEDLTKPYALFVKALKETASSAMAKLSMHDHEQVVLIRSRDGALMLHTLFGSFSDSASAGTLPAH